MDYNTATDAEINKAVTARQLGVELDSKWLPAIIPDYCNNPLDAWPIIEEIWGTLMSLALYDYQVGLGAVQTTIWEARTHMHNGNKLRAAMIVYLKMQEGI